jgi:uncharacterized protein (TIGR03437 family)
MNPRIRTLAVLAFLSWSGLLAGRPVAEAARMDTGTAGRILESLAFEQNLGQFDPGAKFVFRARGYTAFFLANRVTIGYRTKDGRVSTTSMRLAGNRRTTPEGLDTIPVRTGYFRGSSPARWLRNVPHYAKVRYRNVYPGIDLVFREDGSKRLEYDWIIAPGGDPGAIHVKFDREATQTARAGDLLISKDGFEWRHRRPSAYQPAVADSAPVEAFFRSTPGHGWGFEVTAYDRTHPLVIDPVLAFSAIFGSPGTDLNTDSANAIAAAPPMIYIAGNAVSLDFPRNDSPFGVHKQGSDAFVAVVNTYALTEPTGLSVYFLGGSQDDGANGLALDSQGNIYLTGYTDSPDFPLVNAMQTTNSGSGFVAKFKADFSGLVYSTYLGGAGRAIAVDAEGGAFITGSASALIPTAGAFQTKPAGAFAAKLDPAGKLSFATFLGGSGNDVGNAIAVDSASYAYITGSTTSKDFPVTPGVVEPGCTHCAGAFVTKLNPGGTALVFSTFLGGDSAAVGSGIAVDAAGNSYITGVAQTPTPYSVPGFTLFPTTPGAFQRTTNAAVEAFVAKLNPAGTDLLYSTVLAGPSQAGLTGSAATAIAVDQAGNAYVTGSTSQPDFPVVKPLQPALASAALCGVVYPAPAGQLNASGFCSDAFVAKLNSDGSALEWSTYFGGSYNDAGSAIAVSGRDVYVAGRTASSDLPASNTFCNGNLLTQACTGSVFLLDINQAADASGLSAAGVTNAASFVTGLAPGSISTIFGTGFTTAGIQTATSFPLPTEIGGVSVIVDGTAAPLLAVANVNGIQQINFVAPWFLAPSGSPPTTNVTVVVNGVSSITVWAPVLDYQPALYLLDGKHAAAQHSADFSTITSQNPAKPGEVVVLYGTGLGLVQPAVATGAPAPSNPPATTVVNPVVAIGGAQADVLFSGLAPGFANLYQLNVRMPQALPAGDRDVVVTIQTPKGPQVSQQAKLPVGSP